MLAQLEIKPKVIKNKPIKPNFTPNKSMDGHVIYLQMLLDGKIGNKTGGVMQTPVIRKNKNTFGGMAYSGGKIFQKI